MGGVAAYFDCLRCGMDSVIGKRAPKCPHCGSASGVTRGDDGSFECLRCMQYTVITSRSPRCPSCGSGDGIIRNGEKVRSVPSGESRDTG